MADTRRQQDDQALARSDAPQDCEHPSAGMKDGRYHTSGAGEEMGGTIPKGTCL